MASLVVVTLAAAAALQLIASLLAVRALPHSGRYRYTWMAVSLALVLMVERRISPLFDQQGGTFDLWDALYAFAISALLLFGMIGLDRLLRALRAKEESLLQLATTDTLTGLANRRFVLEQLDRELHRCDRSGKPLSILMVDLDHFKDVNDRHGHAVGDTVLAEVAARCRSHLRTVDLCGRIGGEEFVVVLPESDSAGAAATAQRLCADLADRPIDSAGGPLRVTISIGVATYEPRNRNLTLPGAALDRTQRLLQQADRALYGAKASGRNRVQGAAAAAA